MPKAATVKKEVPHQLEQIALNKLVVSEINMRQESPSDTKADKQLKASLKAFGPLQNFIVHADGKKFGVAGGGRRLRLLQELADEGVVPKKMPINCKVVSIDDALSATIAENYHRLAPHPLDECKAFKRLADRDGMTTKQISEEFGVGPQYVRQRLALAKVHPAILKGFLAGDLSLSAVSAYTVDPDQEKQLAAFKSMSVHWRNNANRIRSTLTKSEITLS